MSNQENILRMFLRDGLVFWCMTIFEERFFDRNRITPAGGLSQTPGHDSKAKRLCETVEITMHVQMLWEDMGEKRIADGF